MRSTASELTGLVGNSCARGIMRGGAYSALPSGFPSRTATCPHEPPLEHDHRQPGFLLEFLITESSGVVKRARVHLPEHASARMGGKLIEAVEV